MLYPRNINMGQRIQSSIAGVYIDECNIAHIVWENPSAQNAASILDGINVTPAITAYAADFSSQPDFARQLIVTPGGVTANVLAGTITITGTDAGGNEIIENLVLPAASAAAISTTKAFNTVTSISFPEQGASVTFDVGVTDKLGIPYALEHDTVLFAFFDDVKEATAPVITTNSSDASKNLVDLNSALDGSKVDLYIVV